MARVVIVGSVGWSLLNFRGRLVETLIENGHEVHCCAGSANRDTQENLALLGATFHAIPFDRRGLDPGRDINSLTELYRIFDELAPDVVLSYTIKPVVYGSIAANLANVQSIYALVTGLGIPFSKPGLRGHMMRWTASSLYELGLSYTTRTIFQNADRRQFVQRGIIDRSKTDVVDGSGVDLDYYYPQPLPEEISFILVSRLLAEKGVREYVEAARRVRRQWDHVTFRLAGPPGEGPSGIGREEIQTWVEEGVIDYLGPLDDVREAIGNASVFVLPSYYREGIPRTILEALAMGRPVITTRCPGCRETVDDGENGFLVKPRDVDDLEHAFRKLLAEDWRLEEFSEHSLKLARERFDVDRINQQMLAAMNL